MRRVLFGLVACVAACVGSGSSAPAISPSQSATASHAAFVQWELQWLSDLGATDLRLAMRMLAPPPAEARERAAAEAVIRGEDIGVALGGLDVFSFDERANRLRALRERLGGAPDDGTTDTRIEKLLLDPLDRRLAELRGGLQACHILGLGQERPDALTQFGLIQ